MSVFVCLVLYVLLHNYNNSYCRKLDIANMVVSSLDFKVGSGMLFV